MRLKCIKIFSRPKTSAASRKSSMGCICQIKMSMTRTQIQVKCLNKGLFFFSPFLTAAAFVNLGLHPYESLQHSVGLLLLTIASLGSDSKWLSEKLHSCYQCLLLKPLFTCAELLLSNAEYYKISFPGTTTCRWRRQLEESCLKGYAQLYCVNTWTLCYFLPMLY